MILNKQISYNDKSKITLFKIQLTFYIVYFHEGWKRENDNSQKTIFRIHKYRRVTFRAIHVTLHNNIFKQRNELRHVKVIVTNFPLSKRRKNDQRRKQKMTFGNSYVLFYINVEQKPDIDHFVLPQVIQKHLEENIHLI